MYDGHGTPTAKDRHPRLALVVVRLGLLGALGGSGGQLIVGELAAHSIDWGTIGAFVTFGLLLAAIGECWSLDPTAHAGPQPR